MDVESFPSMEAQPPEGWTLGDVTLTIDRPKKKKIPVVAWRRGALAVHDRIAVGLREAVITHAPTGLRIYSFPTREIAAECAEKLEPLADWSAISKKQKIGSRLFPKVKKIIEEIEGRLDHVESPKGCICQNQHRRGYCTEPGCPYANTPADRGGENG